MATDLTTTVLDVNPLERTLADLKKGVAYATKAQAEASETAVKTAKDFVAFNHASLDACTKAGKILAAGSIDLFNQMAASSQAALGETLSGLQSLIAAKSDRERLELQASLTKASATWAVTESARFAQASIALAEKASAPLTACAVQAAEFKWKSQV